MPRGQSVRVRLLGLNVSPGDFGPQPPAPNPILTACQQDAAAGLYAQAMAGYIRWLAPQMEWIRSRLREEQAKLRDEARGEGQHARTPGIIADLTIGLEYFLEFAVDAKAITSEDRKALLDRGRAALAAAGAAHGSNIAAAEPTGQYLRLLSSALASGAAHIASRDGSQPHDARSWGWHLEGTIWRPQGSCIGWLVNDQVYLEPDAAYACAQSIAHKQGESLTVGEQTLRHRLKDKNLLVTTDPTREKLVVRRVLQGVRREVLHIKWHAMPSSEPEVDGEAA